MTTVASPPDRPSGSPFAARVKLTDRVGQTALRVLSGLAALVAVVLILWITETVFVKAGPSFSRFGLGFIGHQGWAQNKNDFGAADFIFGTAVSSFIALLFAAPIAIAICIYLTELAPSFLRRPVAILVELLAAIPSVILGLWGILFLGPFLGNHFEPFLHSFLGWLPLFGGSPSPYGMMNAAMILTIMSLPIITAVIREVFQATPTDLKEASLALGATRWEMIRTVVLPVARPGIVGAVILGLGRALGEAIAVQQVIGNHPQITASLFNPSSSLAAQIANDFSNASPGLWQGSLFYLAAVLLVMAAIVNIVARLIVARSGAGSAVATGFPVG